MQQKGLEKFAPWYVASCVVPYAPYLTSLAIADKTQVELGYFVAGMLFAGFAVFCNWIAGPFLIWRLSGIRRSFVTLAFVIGAVFPSAVMVSAYFYEPERPAHILTDD
jgi:hypothetical protein